MSGYAEAHRRLRINRDVVSIAGYTRDLDATIAEIFARFERLYAHARLCEHFEALDRDDA